MRFIGTLVLGTTLAFFVPAATVAAQTGGPMAGTWQINLAKSTFSPGKAPQSHTITIVESGTEVKVTTTGTDDKGEPLGTSFTASYDGKDYPVAGSPDYSTVSLRLVDGSTESTRKQNGKFRQTVWTVLAVDGMHFVATTTGTNAAGKQVRNVAVYDKQ